MEIPKFVWVIGFIFTLMISVASIARFFNIDPVNYMGYLMWFVALAIFYAILPSQQVSVFLNK